MASLTWRRLLVALCNLTSSGQVFAQTLTTSVTTIPARSCDTPSCTVTPEPVTSLTITPSSTIVHVPGKVEPLTFEFDPITLTSFKPDPTTLANPGKGTLTLKSITITNFPSASATQSYRVDGDEDITLTAAVTVAVQAKAQLFLAEEVDSGSACKLSQGQTRRDAMSSFLRSRIAGRRPGLEKRTALLEHINDDTKAFALLAIEDARRMIDGFVSYFRGTVTVTADMVPDNIG
jgi:hypothetical protein